ncbi:MAG TPA: hydroxyethylthiazole kinase [Nocardioidaceae bacterium]|nr:hydroxyethylthiazole kinase [Nocardioidaceae bacterium]
MSTVDVPVAPLPVQAKDAADVLQRVRQRAPLVECLTNLVVTGFTANALLAVGASPAMVDEADEAAELARAADALLVNVGTPSEASAAAMRAAAHAAHAVEAPWVLDPVAVGPLTFRTRLATELLTKGPTVVRGNPSEVLSLAGATGSAKGVDSATDSASALLPAFELAQREGTTVAVSGVVDYVTDGRSVVEVGTGDAMMTRVTGVGCVLGALVAACCAVEESPLVAASAATAVLTVAAEVAAENSLGPGSFAVGLLDALYALDAGTLESHLAARSR